MEEEEKPPANAVLSGYSTNFGTEPDPVIWMAREDHTDKASTSGAHTDIDGLAGKRSGSCRG